MTAAIPDGLLTYFADRAQQRAGEAQARLDALSPRERWLVREAAVMGYVQGVRAVPGSLNQQIPPDRDIVATVMEAVGSFVDLYPVLARSPRQLVRKIVRNHQPVARADLVSVVAELAAVDAAQVTQAVDELIDDELLAETAAGITEYTEETTR